MRQQQLIKEQIMEEKIEEAKAMRNNLNVLENQKNDELIRKYREKS